MKRSIIGLTALVVALGAAQAQAQEASESQANSWGLAGEELAVLRGTVVDSLCELGGDCPPDCGGGARQLGILTEGGELVLVTKNGQPLFNGAVPDLLPYCGENVVADGLFAGHGGVKMYQIQLIRTADAEEFSKTDRWTEVWNEDHPDLAEQPGRWYRKDPRVLQRVEEQGYLGLGTEADQAFIAEWY